MMYDWLRFDWKVDKVIGAADSLQSTWFPAEFYSGKLALDNKENVSLVSLRVRI